MAIADRSRMQANPGIPVQTGDVLDGRYTLRDCIAQGGMGRVYMAEQPALERVVAIKLLHAELAPRREYAHCIRDEAIAASRVRNPHCVKIIDCGALPDGTPYLVMEHVPGRSLRDVIADEAVSLARVADLLEQILSALRATHDAGIVHADVKSDNFLVETLDGKDHVTMIDFGLARLAGSPLCLDRHAGATMVLGTPEYMAPEVVRGKPPTPASDLYGAGVILYELLTGTLPFTASTAGAIMRQQLQEVVVPPSLRRPDRELAPLIDRLVLRALDKRPESRFPDAAMFARAVRECVRRPRSPALPATRPLRTEDGASPTSPATDAQAQPVGRLALGSDCGAFAHRDASEMPEPRLLGALPQECGSSSLKVVKKATRSVMSWSVKPR
jgi:eukaryotic-like serine/threonine-protein kinase